MYQSNLPRKSPPYHHCQPYPYHSLLLPYPPKIHLEICHSAPHTSHHHCIQPVSHRDINHENEKRKIFTHPPYHHIPSNTHQKQTVSQIVYTPPTHHSQPCTYPTSDHLPAQLVQPLFLAHTLTASHAHTHPTVFHQPHATHGVLQLRHQTPSPHYNAQHEL